MISVLRKAVPQRAHRDPLIDARCEGGPRNCSNFDSASDLARSSRLLLTNFPMNPQFTAVTLAELAAGPHATENKDERARRQDRLQWATATWDPLPFDADSARMYGRVFAAEQGNPVGYVATENLDVLNCNSNSSSSPPAATGALRKKLPSALASSSFIQNILGNRCV